MIPAVPDIEHAQLTWEALNLVSQSQGSYDTTDAPTWATASNCAIGRTTAVAMVGSAALSLTSLASGNISASTPTGLNGIPIFPEAPVHVLTHCRSAVSSRSCRVDVSFYDNAGDLISTTTGATVASATTRWTRVPQVDVVAPVNAATLSLAVTVLSTAAANEVHYFDATLCYASTTATRTSKFLYCSGAGAGPTAPDAAAISFVGDLDIQALVAPRDWSPSANSAIVSKWTASGNQRSYRLYIDTAGRLNLEWSTNGTATTLATSTTALTVASGDPLWVRASLASATNTATFYTSADGLSWLQLGAAVDGAGSTSIFDSTATLSVGSSDGAMVYDNLLVYELRLSSSLNPSTWAARWAFTGLDQTATTVTGIGTAAGVMTLGSNAYLDEWSMGMLDLFAATIVERSDDATGYQRIARITSPLVYSMDDWELRRNTNVSYRVQYEDLYGALSYYTPVRTVSIVLLQCGYILTTNEQPELTQGWADSAPRTYEFEDDYVEYEMYGRDYAVAFRGTENRGDVFTMNLWLYMDGAPASNNVPSTLRGRKAFQSLIDIVRAPVSYICVLNEDGDRWFAALRMDNSKATRREPGGKYEFPIRVRQVTDLPSVIDVGAGSVPQTAFTPTNPEPPNPNVAIYDSSEYDDTAAVYE